MNRYEKASRSMLELRTGEVLKVLRSCITSEQIKHAMNWGIAVLVTQAREERDKGDLPDINPDMGKCSYKEHPPRVVSCIKCQGSGYVKVNDICTNCEGSGRVWVTTQVFNYVTPYSYEE